MKALRPSCVSFLRLGLLAWLIALGLALFLPTPVYADDCLWEPWNLADCLRTQGFREVYVAVLAGLGVGPAILSQILADASKSSLTDQDVNDLILNRIKKLFQKTAVRQVGANLATNTADLLNNMDSSPPQEQQPPPPKKEPPLEHIYDESPGRILSGARAEDYLKKTGALEKGETAA